ncbi:DinB family protein [Hyphobacterium sp.]|uniref:DinB family protein n=1 Tax=Hyphobacterium sp. TaxID=2004662 RepID=UPI003B51D50E
MREHFGQMAAYNAWANARLYAAVGELPNDRLMADLGAYFDSIFGTLTHILIADRIWMHRLTGEGPMHADLRDRPFAGLAELQAERCVMDQRISEFVTSLAAADFPAVVNYHNMAGTSHSLPRQVILSHVVNHQTHHRGQAHHMLSVEGVDPPPLDLLYFMLPAA